MGSGPMAAAVSTASEDGYIVLDTIGLSRENWADKEARDSYLFGWCNDLDEELSSMAADFVKYELPYLM